MKRIRYASLCLSLFLLTAAGCSGGTEEAPKPAPMKVVVAQAVTAKIPVEAAFTATLAAKETVEVRARINGYIKERLFTEGASVKAGDRLYTLDDRDLVAALETAKANTAKAKTTWENDDVTAKRYIPLAEKGSVSVQDRDTYVTRAAESLSRYEAAKAQEEKAAVDLSYATIATPITGYINRSLIDVGGYVQAGSTLLTTIYRTDPIRAEFSITDREFAQIQRMVMTHGGNPKAATFRLELGDQHFPYPHSGTLEMADPVVDSKTNTIGVRAEFPNPDYMLRPGLFVNVIGSLGEREALTVPEVAIFDQANGKAVYVVDDKNTLILTPVEVGTLVGEARVVRKGLSAGQQVVVEGLVTARPGMTVEIVSKQTPAATGDATPQQPQSRAGGQ